MSDDKINECTFYCICNSYNLTSIADYLRGKAIKSRIFNREALHFLYDIGDSQFDVVVFSYGCIVFWGLDEGEISEVIGNFEQFSSEPLKYPISDICRYTLISQDATSYIDMENDVIMINKDENVQLTKTSFSYGLSQSVKLSVFEDSVDKTIEENKAIPQELISSGKISLSKVALSKKIGALFTERNYINLNNNILDTPEFFWKHPRYEQFYEMSIKFLDLTQRIHVLNTKLDIIRDLYSILSDELKHAHSSRLEIVVILLIFIEVCIGIFELLIRH